MHAHHVDIARVLDFFHHDDHPGNFLDHNMSHMPRSYSHGVLVYVA